MMCLNRCDIAMTTISVFGPQISIFVRVNFFHSVNGDRTNYPPPYPGIPARDPLGGPTKAVTRARAQAFRAGLGLAGFEPGRAANHYIRRCNMSDPLA